MHGNFIDVMHKDLKELEGSEVKTVSFLELFLLGFSSKNLHSLTYS
jgi:hypothetical protein